MNEQLQLAVSTLIQTSLNAIDKGTAFLSNQIPEVIQQLLLWKAIASFIEFSYGIFIIGGSFAWLIYQYKYWTTTVTTTWGTKEVRLHQEAGAFSLLNILIIIPLIYGSKCINLIWLQIWIAPKLYLIEYAKDFLK